MKKFLSIVSLMIVALMIVAMPVVGAEEVVDAYDGIMVKPQNSKIYYATDVSAATPSIDGVIEDGEYGQAIRISTPMPLKAETYGVGWDDRAVDSDFASQYMDVYFAYDESNIYMALYDAGFKGDNGSTAKNNVPFRSNYTFQFGFDLNDIGSFFQFGGFMTHAQWPSLSYFEFGGKKSTSLKTYELISECVVAKVNPDTGDLVAFGDLLSANGNPNYTDSSWALVAEFAFDKSVIADCLNQTYFMDYEVISDAMWVSLITETFKADGADGLEPFKSEFYKWLGTTDITDKQAEYAAYGLYDGDARDALPDLVVFGDENTEIKIANPFPTRETEPVSEDTEPVVDTEDTATDSVENTTDDTAATTEPTASGCGAIVSVAGIALVAALGTCTAFVAKKKED